MKIKVDMHVHPNLPKSENRALTKAEKWWTAFQKKGIKCIISVEHSYKDSERNFKIMKKTAPKGYVVLPGSEIITKEGVDIVVFSNNDSIFNDKKLMTPYSMKTETAIKYLQKKKYPHYISHPFTLGTTSILKNMGMKKGMKLMESAMSVEVHNTSFSGTAKILKKTRLSKIFKDKYEKMKNVEHLPKEYCKKIKFIPGGSDAHTPSEIGSFMTIESKSIKLNDVYTAITTNMKDNFCINDKFSIPNLCIALPTVFSEWCAKKKYKLFH